MGEFVEVSYFILFFIVVWVGIVALVSFIGGWHSLSKRYNEAFKELNYEKSFKIQSLRIGLWTSYKSCVNVSIYHDGIKITPLFVYRIFHPPLYIKWDDIEMRAFSGKFIRKLTFYLNDKKIILVGRSVKYLEKQNIIN